MFNSQQVFNTTQHNTTMPAKKSDDKQARNKKGKADAKHPAKAARRRRGRASKQPDDAERLLAHAAEEEAHGDWRLGEVSEAVSPLHRRRPCDEDEDEESQAPQAQPEHIGEGLR